MENSKYYYFGQDYSLTYKRLDKLEEELIEMVYKFSTTRPLVWQNIHDHVLTNSLISYVKDTTCIISTYELTKNDAYWLFHILKEFLRKGQITKILYKKEFIIVHFYNKFIIDVLTTRKKWLSLVVYYQLKKYFNGKFYLDTLYEDNNQRILLDLLYVSDDEKQKITFNVTKPLITSINSEIIVYYLYIYEERNVTTNRNIDKIKFNYQFPIFLKEIKKIIFS